MERRWKILILQSEAIVSMRSIYMCLGATYPERCKDARLRSLLAGRRSSAIDLLTLNSRPFGGICDNS